ncbi:LysR family transcriptional regulator [Marinobacterium rhizophilum]|uniref:LysR family transcriptional regulator n=1 Tax=Marinobacterium rhizophilum TaxID=420402 RepID=A0ABY5HK46_9GAMM|nr:LysR family transcriptional regulator [Marinobacterium rhizophilum]UTW12236.1 LysR family transcriptional regulator [Marinobacterium rhizophilum]
MRFNIHDVDIKLLRIFFAIYECGGFTQAQTMLGMSQANISAKMSKLEQRMGTRLCDRGTSGFKLTTEGETIIEASKQLFAALDEFQDSVADLGSQLTGRLNLGLADNSITNPNSKIDEAIARFMDSAPAVELSIFIGDPSELEAQVLDGRLQLAIGVFNKTQESLQYKPLYTTAHALFCGRRHELFSVPDDEISDTDLIAAKCIDRGYLESVSDLKLNIELPTEKSNSHYNLEGIALLVLSGRHIANLPLHYAQKWVDSGQMRLLKAEHTLVKPSILAVYRSKKTLSAITSRFLSELELCHRSPDDQQHN